MKGHFAFIAILFFAIYFSESQGKALKGKFSIDGKDKFEKAKPIVDLDWKDEDWSRPDKFKEAVNSHQPDYAEIRKKTRRGREAVHQFSEGVWLLFLNIIRAVIAVCCCCGCVLGGMYHERICEKRLRQDPEIQIA